MNSLQRASCTLHRKKPHIHIFFGIFWNYKGQNCCSKKLQPKRCKIDILQRIPYMSCTMTLAPMDTKAGLNHSDPVFLLTLAITMQLHLALQGTGQPLITIMPVHGALFNQVELINLHSKTVIQKSGVRALWVKTRAHTTILIETRPAKNHQVLNDVNELIIYHIVFRPPLLATVSNKDL